MKHAIAVFTIIACLGAPALAASVPSAQVSAQVVDSNSNAPIAGVRVSAFPEGSSIAESVALSDANGKFTLRDLRGGDYRLLFEHNGYPKSLAGGIGVKPREHLVLISAFALRTKPGSERIVDPCGSLIQPGQTADVYIICSGH